MPSPDAVTVRAHHSFVRLPDDDYTPRSFDPRAGYFGTSYQDYSTPIGETLTKRFINRHRLQKKNPNAKMSEPVEPIVYYLDPGTPEPIRSALIEGASWWNQAFEAAGYKNAFQVKMLPDGAHPLDVRYNVINWVHRSTRGWSYGSTVSDPRTGEIIKGHVLLGSLRVRQDYLLAEGLLAPYRNGTSDKEDPMLQMALARIRQLAAHEVGHTLGLAHNFAASVNDRASVMDYPVPKVAINNDNTLDLSDNLGFSDMIDRVMEATWKMPPENGVKGAVQRTIDFVTLYNMIRLAANKNASAQVRAITSQKLSKLHILLLEKAKSAGEIQWESAYSYGAKIIEDFMEDPDMINELSPPLDPPPGFPIGSCDKY